MVKLDLKDKKILYELSKNCRIPLSVLSKKVALSREVIDYRIKKLIQNKVIIDFITEIDETKLGYNRHLIYLAFQNIDEQTEKEVIKYVTQHPFVSWTTTSTGKWSIIFDFIAKDLNQIDNLFNELGKFGELIDEYKVISQISFEHFNSKYYGFEEQIETKKTKPLSHKVDSTDLKILKILTNNARVGYVELANKLKLSPNAIKNRIKSLIQSGIIKSFFIQPNKQLLGYEQYYITLDLLNQSIEKEIISYAKSHNSINAYYRPVGIRTIELAAFVKNSGELRKIILDLRNKFGNFIKIRDTVLFYEEPKSNYLPTGVFEIKSS